ncbi:Ribosomal RNA-processing protein 8, partial [Stegodyphus mimosarum]
MDFSLPDSDVWDDSPSQNKFLENYFRNYMIPSPDITAKKSKRTKQKLSNLNEDVDHVLQLTKTQICHIARHTKTKNEKITSGSNHLNTKKQKNDTLKNYLDSSEEILSSKAKKSNSCEKRKLETECRNRMELLHSEPASSLQGDKLSSKKKMKQTSETASHRGMNLTNSKHDKNNIEPEKINKCNKNILRSNKLKKSSPASKIKSIKEFPNEDLELIEEIKNSSVYKELQNFTGQQQFFKQIDSSNNVSESSNDKEHIPDVSENEVQMIFVEQTSQSIIEHETKNSNFDEKKKVKNKLRNKTASFHSEPTTTLHGDKLPSNRKKKKKNQILKTGVDDVMGDMVLTNLKHGKNNVQLEKLNEHNKKTLCTNDTKKISPGSKDSNVTEAAKLSNECIDIREEVKRSCEIVQNFSRKLQFPRQINSSCNFRNSSNEGLLDKSENKVQVTSLKHYSSQSAMEYKTVPETSLYKNKKSKSTSFINKAREMLNAAKFRYLNEKLYTESGRDAYEYFQNNANEFEDYHSGYKMQVQKWPMNPVDLIIKDLHK